MRTRSHLLPAALFALLATSFSLTPVFRDQGWFWPGLLAIALAFGIGWAARRLDVPVALTPALSALGLVMLLGVVFYPDTLRFVVLPSAATLDAVGAGFSSAANDMRVLAAPAEATRGLVLLTTTGIYVVAALVDLLVFSARKPASAGLPLLALYVVPASLAPRGTSVLPFVVAAAGYLALLIAEGRDYTRGWGRRLVGAGRVEEVTDLSPVSRVGRRLGAAAVGLAVVVPVFVPSLGEGLLKSGAGTGLFDGAGNGVRRKVASPVVSIVRRVREQKGIPFLEVHTERPDYLRATALDVFDGTNWLTKRQNTSQRNRVDDRRVPVPTELRESDVPTRESSYRVEVTDNLESNWLPLQYTPYKVSADGDWRYHPQSLSVLSSRQTTAGLDYRATSLVAEPSEDDLDADGAFTAPDNLTDYVQLPRGDVPAIVDDVLDEVTAGQETTYDKVLAIQNYFLTDDFTYSLDVDEGMGQGDIASFLRDKKGYCEQYAAAMAYMVRLLRVPARVAVGFTPGQQVARGRYLVTSDDAHAWPEVWFPSAGWVRFEPTPRSGAEQPGYAERPAIDQPIGSGSPSPSASNEPAPTASASASARPFRDETPEPQAGGAGGGGAGRAGQAALVALLLLLVLATPAAVATLLRGRRWRRAADAAALCQAAWQTVAEAAEDVGKPLRGSDSPRASAQRLVLALRWTGEPADAIWRLAAAEERARYARNAPPPDGLDRDARLVRTELLADLSTRRRLRAVLLPPSLVRRTREAAVLGFDAVDRWQAAFWGRVRTIVRRVARVPS